MRKLLQIMTVILLVLSVAALTLGILLFNRRELLKGRTQALERALVQLSAIIEAPQEEEPAPAALTYPERDIAELTAQPPVTPETTAFWKDYPAHLEVVDRPFASMRVDEFMNYYRMDPITQKPLKNASGYRETTGPGTMDESIQKLVQAAQSELDMLGQTRHQLVRVREELISTIQVANERTATVRQKMAEINDLNGTIAGLENDKRQLQGQVATLEGEKQALTDQVTELEKKVEEQTEEIRLATETIAAQRERIKELVEQSKREGIHGTGPTIDLANKVEAGRKGKVASVNQDWTYVVLELTDEFVAEIDAIREALAKSENPGIPTIDLFLKRGDSFVSKIRLMQIRREEKLAIADVLVDWQQMPVMPGDEVFY